MTDSIHIQSDLTWRILYCTDLTKCDCISWPSLAINEADNNDASRRTILVSDVFYCRSLCLTVCFLCVLFGFVVEFACSLVEEHIRMSKLSGARGPDKIDMDV